jgi:ubiquinone/menaquinone biosynthesis C-methylase UbiE
MSNTASTYTQGHSEEVLRAHKRRTASNNAQFLLPHLKPHYSLLDIGCGPGTITASFLEYIPAGSATGVDISDSLIAANNETFPSSKYSNLKFEVGNVLDGLKYEDESFDVVFTNQTILHIPDPVKAMREARRVLKSGGLLAMHESDHFGWYPYLPGLKKLDKALHGMLNSSGAPGLGRARELHVWAREAGFEREKMKVGVSGQVSSTEEERREFVDVHVGRLRGEGVGGKMRELGIMEGDLEEMIKDLERWRDDVDGWYTNWCCEVIAVK